MRCLNHLAFSPYPQPNHTTSCQPVSYRDELRPEETAHPNYSHGAQEYVHFTANLVSRTCGGLAGAMLVNWVPSLKIM